MAFEKRTTIVSMATLVMIVAMTMSEVEGRLSVGRNLLEGTSERRYLTDIVGAVVGKHCCNKVITKCCAPQPAPSTRKLAASLSATSGSTTSGSTASAPKASKASNNKSSSSKSKNNKSSSPKSKDNKSSSPRSKRSSSPKSKASAPSKSKFGLTNRNTAAQGPKSAGRKTTVKKD